ncbi:hypothetical protein CRX72_18460 [Pantoea sp. BRM17]|nr:hypothetical protein CRX72_18460 [Pantoea sp. BRM17]
MERQQIKEAFISFMKRAPSDRCIVITGDVAERLGRVNWHLTKQPMTGYGATRRPSATLQRRRVSI